MYKKIHTIILLFLLTILGCTKIASNYYWDISQNKINTLTPASIQLLSKIEEPLQITIYSPDMEILNTSSAILAPYKKQSNLISIKLNENILDPELASKLKIISDDCIVVSYKKFQRALDIKLGEINEQKISSLIQQVLNHTNHWVVFLSGHRETDLMDRSPLGISDFAKQFTTQGIHVASLNLAQEQNIPNNVSTLVVVNPELDLLPLEKALIDKYLQQGGKLLWFTEPGSKVTALLREEFGVKLAKGIAIDPESSKLGSPHPALKILINYPEHQITNDIKTATILPWSGHLDISNPNHNWQPKVFLASNDQSWTYTGTATDDIKAMAMHKEITGPLNIGIAFSRTSDNTVEQRAMVIADSSFITNKYLALYANSQLANNLLNWVQNDTNHQVFSPTPARDLNYQPGNLDRFIFRYGFTIILPLLLIGVGLLAERRI